MKKNSHMPYKGTEKVIIFQFALKQGKNQDCLEKASYWPYLLLMSGSDYYKELLSAQSEDSLDICSKNNPSQTKEYVVKHIV